MTRLYLLAAASAAIFAAGVAADRLAPLIGANANIHRLETSREAWRSNAQAWRAYGKAEAAAFRQSEAYRAKERLQAVSAVNDSGKTCAARVARARASATAIQAIIMKEPKHDPRACPLRELVPAERLRDAISSAATR